MYKVFWDLWILIILLIVSLIVPVRLAFVEEDSSSWFLFYIVTDLFFLIDIILTFNTSIADAQSVYEITDKKVIAKKYLKGWFWVDLISILPLDVIMRDSNETQTNVLARFAKIGKLYKLMRMIRLAKVLKLLKNNTNVVSHFTQKMRISSGKERLLFFVVFFSFYYHISTCMFIFVAQFDDDQNSWLWDPYYYLMDEDELYIMSFYFIVTTTSTVGYGDLSASTTIERIFCILTMLGGVMAFTFISGALSSILSNYDQHAAQLNERLLYLGKLRQQHNITSELYNDIRKALQYDSKTNTVGLDQFIQQLPMHLRLEVSEEIHKESFEKFEIFKKIDMNGNFIAWISARLKQQMYPESTYFYQKGDSIDNFYLSIRGVGSFVMSDMNNEMFSIIDPILFTAGTRSKKFQNRLSVQQYFGAEDIVINMAA